MTTTMLLFHFKYHLYLWIFVTNFYISAISSEPLPATVMVNNHSVQVISNVCKNFSANPNKEIVSPNYPDLYPKEVKCEKIIEAHEGHVIRLEFRELFKVERSYNCDNDYLEIRDGRHPFSTRLGRFCGDSFPADVHSTDRFLYLYFKTDDSIEANGFKISYDFIKKSDVNGPSKSCDFPRNGFEGTFGTSDIHPQIIANDKSHKVVLYCIWNIEVESHLQIFMNITNFSLATQNKCDLLSIEVFVQEENKENVDKSELINRKAVHSKNKFCGSITEPIVTRGHRMTIVYYEDISAVLQLNTNKTSYFEAQYTAFRVIQGTEKCLPKEFDCGDSTCIDASLKCNRRNNCKYATDEEKCTLEVKSIFSSMQVNIILIVGMAILISIMIPSCFNFYKKLKNLEETESVIDPSSVHGSTGQRTTEGSIADTNHMVSINGITNLGTDDDDGCYVPDVDLSVFMKRSNGGHSLSMQDSPPVSGEETPLDSTLPNNFDSADPLIMTTPTSSNSNGPQFLVHVAPLVPQILHKKNSAYYRPSNYNDGPRTSTPPPPPPPPMVYYNDGLDSFDSINNSCYTPESDNNNSMFMPPPPTLEEVEESDAIFGLPAMSTGIPNDRNGRRLMDPRSRFKADVAIDDANRPRSFESTKSAPDVIGRI